MAHWQHLYFLLISYSNLGLVLGKTLPKSHGAGREESINHRLFLLFGRIVLGKVIARYGFNMAGYAALGI